MTKKPTLDFRTLLSALALIYFREEFDSKSASKSLRGLFEALGMLTPKLDERLSPKLISNDLRRLYFMGFLRRRKVRRYCRRKNGKVYACGYKYLYQINEQGFRYITHILSESLASDNLDLIRDLRIYLLGFRLMLGVREIEKDNPLGGILLRDVKKEVDEMFSGRGYRRFRCRETIFREKLRMAALISDLLNENEKLKKENEKLKKALEHCMATLSRSD